MLFNVQKYEKHYQRFVNESANTGYNILTIDGKMANRLHWTADLFITAKIISKRETDRQRERETDRERDRQTETETYLGLVTDLFA